MFVVLRNSIKIFQAVVVLLSLSGVSLAASREDVLEGVKEECRSVISAFITAQQDAQEWHRSEIEHFRTLSNDQEIRDFVRRYNDDEDLLGQPLEVIRQKAEELFVLKDKEVSARINRYETLEGSISHWAEEGVLSKQLKTLLLQALVDLNERQAHPEVVARTLPSDVEVYADKQRQLAEEDINRGKDLAFLLQLMGKPLGQEIDGIFSRFTQNPIFGGHFSVLQAYVQDLIKAPPLPDHYLYGSAQNRAQKVFEEEMGKIKEVKDATLQTSRGLASDSSLGKMASGGRRYGTPAERLKGKWAEREQKTLLEDGKSQVSKRLEALKKMEEASQKRREDYLKFSDEPDMRNLRSVEEKAIALLAQYRSRRIAAGQWRVEEAAAKAAAVAALEDEKEKERQREVVVPSAAAAANAFDEDDEIAAAFHMQRISAGSGDLSEDEAEDDDELPEEMVDPRAEHVRHMERKAQQAVAVQHAREDLLPEVVQPLLSHGDHVLWEHFWGIPQSEKMRWGKFKSLFKTLGFKKTSESGGSLRKFSRDGRSFDIHNPHGQRGDMLGLFDIKRIRRNLESKFGWSVETYKEKIN